MHFQAIKLMEFNFMKKVIYFLMDVPHIPRKTVLSQVWLPATWKRLPVPNWKKSELTL